MTHLSRNPWVQNGFQNPIKMPNETKHLFVTQRRAWLNKSTRNVREKMQHFHSIQRGTLGRNNQLARHQSSLATLPRTRIHIHSNVTSWRMAGEQGDWESSGRVVFFCACPSSTATTVWKRQAMPVYGLIDPFLFACFLPW